MGFVSGALISNATPASTVHAAVVAEMVTVGWTTGSFTDGDGGTTYWGTSPGASNATGNDFTMFMRQTTSDTTLEVWMAETWDDSTKQMDNWAMGRRSTNETYAADGTTGQGPQDLSATMTGISVSNFAKIRAFQTTWDTLSDQYVARVEFDYVWIWGNTDVDGSEGGFAGVGVYEPVDPAGAGFAVVVFGGMFCAHTRFFGLVQSGNYGGQGEITVLSSIITSLYAYGQTSSPPVGLFPDAWVLTKGHVDIYDEATGVNNDNMLVGLAPWWWYGRLEVSNSIQKGDVVTIDGVDWLCWFQNSVDAYMAELG